MLSITHCSVYILSGGLYLKPPLLLVTITRYINDTTKSSVRDDQAQRQMQGFIPNTPQQTLRKSKAMLMRFIHFQNIHTGCFFFFF